MEFLTFISQFHFHKGSGKIKINDYINWCSHFETDKMNGVILMNEKNLHQYFTICQAIIVIDKWRL